MADAVVLDEVMDIRDLPEKLFLHGMLISQIDLSIIFIWVSPHTL